MAPVSLAALTRTLGLCAVIEAAIVVVLYAVTASLAGSVILSIVVFGPISLFIAGPIYRRMLKSK